MVVPGPETLLYDEYRRLYGEDAERSGAAVGQHKTGIIRTRRST
jgi:hypothetical protein